MNVVGLVFSYIFIGLIIFSSQLLVKKRILTASMGRKFIHIGVSHWWILAFLMMEGLHWLLIGPVSFIIINFLIARFNLIPSMNSEEGRNYGTVYFPVSLTLLVCAVSLLDVSPVAAGIGILTMGWGDGMASVIGENIRSPSFTLWGNRKSVSGIAAMFLFSVIVAGIGFYIADGTLSPFYILATAAAATVMESITPFGVDNITVPLLVTFVAQVFISGWPG